MKRNDSIIPKKYDLARFKGKLTERMFYDVDTLSGLPIRKLFQAFKAAVEDLFREDRMNELYRDLRDV